jgi:hypothetical protein
VLTSATKTTASVCPSACATEKAAEQPALSEGSALSAVRSMSCG